MKRGIGRIVFKVPFIVIGIVVLSLVGCFVLTDPAPSTLPRRLRRLLADVMELTFAPSSRSVKSTPDAQPSPPLINVPVVTVAAVGQAVRDESYVVGVEIGGEARAYPLNMLSRPDHHIVDDTLGGQPIAVTWCGLCQSPVVYERSVEGKTLTLFVSGEMYGENMVMQDVETGSTWPQMLGEATSGPLKGKSLDQIPSVWTDWKSWRTQHPKTTVPNITQTVDYYRHDEKASDSAFESRYFSNLQWGLVRGTKSVSWPLKELAQKPAVNDSFAGLPFVIVYDSQSATITAFERRVGNTELSFRLDSGGLIDDQTSSVWDPITGLARGGEFVGRRLTPVPGVVSHLRAWATLHPDSEVRSSRAG